ncbi:hypothetical protein DFQ30_004454, partial [Apophysomyces sp. BC1015]
VAQLAGIPQAVIRAARRHLVLLEQQSLGQPAPQLDLFASTPQEVPDTTGQQHADPADNPDPASSEAPASA